LEGGGDGGKWRKREGLEGRVRDGEGRGGERKGRLREIPFISDMVDQN
jgi:hypothetical protein